MQKIILKFRDDLIPSTDDKHMQTQKHIPFG